MHGFSSADPPSLFEVKISVLMCGITKEGNPAGISPMRRMLSVSNTIIESKVTPTKATNWAGTYLRRCLGNKNKVAKVSKPNNNSLNFMLAKISGNEDKVPMTPPAGAACPSRGDNCKIIKMTPMPDMKPEITL